MCSVYVSGKLTNQAPQTLLPEPYHNAQQLTLKLKRMRRIYVCVCVMRNWLMGMDVLCWIVESLDCRQAGWQDSISRELWKSVACAHKIICSHIFSNGAVG